MKRLTLPLLGAMLATPVFGQPASMQSPAYQECTKLAASSPEQALAKADAWLKIDSGVAAYHCRAMALFGLHRYAEAGDTLITARSGLAPDDVTTRSYVTRQAVQAYQNANAVDKALNALNTQIGEIGDVRGDNANAAKQTSGLLLERSRIHVTYGKLNDAARDLDHAVSLTPVNEEVLLARASVFETIGDTQLARNDLDAVLTINPNNTVAKQHKLKLAGKATVTVQPQPEKVLAPVASQPPAPSAAAAAAPAAAAQPANEPAALPAQHISKKPVAAAAKPVAPAAVSSPPPLPAATVAPPTIPALPAPGVVTPPALPAPSAVAKP
jgi:tetratricopeptide (TPR) repeat protein